MPSTGLWLTWVLPLGLLPWVWRGSTVAGVLAAIGILGVATSSLDPSIPLPADTEVTVLVDVSPSVRNAAFHSPELTRRLERWLAGRPFRVVGFADGLTGTIPPGQAAAWVDARRTRVTIDWNAPTLLLSDGVFHRSVLGSGRVYPIVEPSLAQPRDAGFSSLHVSGPRVTVRITNTRGRPVQLTSRSGATETTQAIEPGVCWRQFATDGHLSRLELSLEPGDAFPENDRVSIVTAGAAPMRLWVSKHPAPTGFTGADPGSPPPVAEMLVAQAIVLADIPTDDRWSSPLRDYLANGGHIVLTGGQPWQPASRRALGGVADAWPLLPSPPDLPARWVILLDASGSMAAREEGRTRWQWITQAASRLVDSVPPADDIQLLRFSDRIQVLGEGRSVREQLERAAVGVEPRGPTNLQAAIDAISAMKSPPGRTRIVLLTDAQGSLRGLDDLGRRLREQQARVYVMQTQAGTASADLATLCQVTGGTLTTALDPPRWAPQAAEIARAAVAEQLNDVPVALIQLPEAPRVTWPSEVKRWNVAYAHRDAVVWATASHNGATWPLAATRRVGLGLTTAVAFAAAPMLIDQVVDTVGGAIPTDPGFRTSLDAMAGTVEIRTRADAASIRGEIASPGMAPRQVRATGKAPELLEMVVGRLDQPGALALFQGNQRRPAVALPGFFSPEFDHLGLDREALEDLARQTGGAVFDWDTPGPLPIAWPLRRRSLAPVLLGGGCVLLCAGVVLRLRQESRPA